MTNRSSARRRAALLLEVVVAMTIMIATLGILGSQLNAGLQMTSHADEQARATQLGDRILALLELDQRLMQQVFVDQKNDGDFGDQFPGWHWRVLVKPIEDTPGLGQVMIEILRQQNTKELDSIEGAKVVRRFHLLKADPGRLDLTRDFGFSQDQVDALAASIPIPGFDPAAIDPQALVAMDPATLLELAPQLMQLFQQLAASGGLPGGGLPGGLGNLQGLLGGLAGGGPPGGGGGQLAMLREFILAQAGGRISEEEVDQALANFGRGGMNGGGGPPGGGGGGGGGRGPGDGGGGRGPGGNNGGDQGGNDASPPPGGFTRDGLRDMLRGALGDRITDDELEQALDAYEQGQGNRAGGGG